MNTRKIIIGTTLAFALASFMFAEDSASDLFADASADTAASTESSSSASAFTLRLSGEHGFAYHMPAYSDNDNWTYSGSIKRPKFTNDLGAEVQDGTVKLVSHWEFDIDPLSATASSPNANWAESVSIAPLENYVSWNPEKLKLSAGYQIFSWGVADKKNPTDNLNPRDYTVGVNADKIPVLAADLVVYPADGVSIEAVGIPSKSASQYPQDFDALVVKSSGGMLSSGNVSFADKRFDPANFVAGAKVNFNSAVCDLSLDYLYDIDQYYTPTITLKSVPYTVGSMYQLNSVTLERKRIHRIGGDAKTTIGKFGLWLEGAYSITENSGSDDYSVRRSKLEYTLGSDVNFGPNDVGYVNLQYIGSWIPGYVKDNANAQSSLFTAAGATSSSALSYYQRAMVNQLGLETEGLMQGVTCNVKYELADSLVTPQVTAAYMMPFNYDDSSYTRYGSLVVNPEIDIKPVDSFHIVVGADLYYAWHKANGSNDITLDTTTNAVGSYTPSNNVYLKVVYKWNDDLKK